MFSFHNNSTGIFKKKLKNFAYKYKCLCGIQAFTLIFPNDKYTLTQPELYKFTRTVLQQDHPN